MNLIPNRITVYVKDVQNITGRSERYSYRLLSDIRKKNNKLKGGFITVEEFCMHTGFKKEEVSRFLV